MENSVAVPQNIKARTIIVFRYTTSGYFCETNKDTKLKEYCTLMFTAALLTSRGNVMDNTVTTVNNASYI